MRIRHKKTHFFMLLLILIWAVDSVTVSAAVDSVNQVFLLCAKYLCALPLVAAVTLIKSGLVLPRREDWKTLVLSTLFGDILCFFLEYTALKYLPVSTVTILLGLLPAASYLTDSLMQKRKPGASALLTIFASVAGLMMVVLNGEQASGGHWIGYVCCAGCVAAWVIYGYLTRSLDKNYGSASITLYQMVLASAFMLPIALTHLPGAISGRDIWISIVLMGVLSSGAGCLIEVKGLIDLGTTVSGIYLNLLPVVTAFAGMLFLHERMTPVQLAGAATVIVCGFLVERQTEAMPT